MSGDKGCFVSLFVLCCLFVFVFWVRFVEYYNTLTLLSPNYFGEMLMWTCCWLLALSSSPSGMADLSWWACAVSPLFTYQILLNTAATGVAQANGKGLKRYYESKHAERYKKYRASTSILVPMVGYRYVPLWLKRTLFLDLERYEYRPRVGNPKGSSK